MPCDVPADLRSGLCLAPELDGVAWCRAHARHHRAVPAGTAAASPLSMQASWGGASRLEVLSHMALSLLRKASQDQLRLGLRLLLCMSSTLRMGLALGGL